MMLYLVLGFSIIPFLIVATSNNKNFIISMLCGCLAAATAIPIEKILYQFFALTTQNLSVWNTAFFLAALPEESLKYIILISTEIKIRNKKDIPILFILCGLGFSTIENLIYISRYSNSDVFFDSTYLMTIRFILPSSMHMLCAAITSIGLITNPSKRYHFLLFAVIFHGFYDYVAMNGNEAHQSIILPVALMVAFVSITTIIKAKLS